ncbi:Glycosylphosphatidylinositol anchor synthesis protein, partial [Pseudoloma neurophilia]
QEAIYTLKQTGNHLKTYEFTSEPVLKSAQPKLFENNGSLILGYDFNILSGVSFEIFGRNIKNLTDGHVLDFTPNPYFSYELIIDSLNFLSLAGLPTSTTTRCESIITGKPSNYRNGLTTFQHMSVENHLFSNKNSGNKIKLSLYGDLMWDDLLPEHSIYTPLESYSCDDHLQMEEAVIEKLLRDYQQKMRSGNVMFCHLIALDHLGHLLKNIYHSRIQKCLQVYKRLIKRIIQTLRKDTLLLIMSDHGVEISGGHGGGRRRQLESVGWFIGHKISNHGMSDENLYNLNNKLYLNETFAHFKTDKNAENEFLNENDLMIKNYKFDSNYAQSSEDVSNSFFAHNRTIEDLKKQFLVTSQYNLLPTVLLFLNGRIPVHTHFTPAILDRNWLRESFYRKCIEIVYYKKYYQKPFWNRHSKEIYSIIEKILPFSFLNYKKSPIEPLSILNEQSLRNHLKALDNFIHNLSDETLLRFNHKLMNDLYEKWTGRVTEWVVLGISGLLLSVFLQMVRMSKRNFSKHSILFVTVLFFTILPSVHSIFFIYEDVLLCLGYIVLYLSMNSTEHESKDENFILNKFILNKLMKDTRFFIFLLTYYNISNQPVNQNRNNSIFYLILLTFVIYRNFINLLKIFKTSYFRKSKKIFSNGGQNVKFSIFIVLFYCSVFIFFFYIGFVKYKQVVFLYWLTETVFHSICSFQVLETKNIPKRNLLDFINIYLINLINSFFSFAFIFFPDILTYLISIDHRYLKYFIYRRDETLFWMIGQSAAFQKTQNIQKNDNLLTNNLKNHKTVVEAKKSELQKTAVETKKSELQKAAVDIEKSELQKT